MRRVGEILPGRLATLAILAFLGFPVFSHGASVFRISVGEPGVYRVPFEALVVAGLSSEPLETSRLGLDCLEQMGYSTRELDQC